MFTKGLAIGDWIISDDNQTVALFIKYTTDGNAIGVYEHQAVHYPTVNLSTLYAGNKFRKLNKSERENLNARLRRFRKKKDENHTMY